MKLISRGVARRRSSRHGPMGARRRGEISARSEKCFACSRGHASSSFFSPSIRAKTALLPAAICANVGAVGESWTRRRARSRSRSWACSPRSPCSSPSSRRARPSPPSPSSAACVSARTLEPSGPQATPPLTRLGRALGRGARGGTGRVRPAAEDARVCHLCGREGEPSVTSPAPLRALQPCPALRRAPPPRSGHPPYTYT